MNDIRDIIITFSIVWAVRALLDIVYHLEQISRHIRDTRHDLEARAQEAARKEEKK